MIGQALGGTPLGFEPQGSTSVTHTATGIVASASAGSFKASPQKIITGVSASGAITSPTKQISDSIPLTGVSASGETGNVLASQLGQISLVGLNATGNAGSLVVAENENLSGVSGSASSGSVAKQDSSTVLGGQATGSIGTFSTSSSRTITISTGISASGSSGIARPNANAILSGVFGSGQVRQPATSNVIAAATSNIHVGLSAWVTGTSYHVGDRISRGGQAYECITNGISSGGPSGTSNNITDGTAHWKWLSAIDFTDVQNWVNSIPATLTQPYLGLMWNDGAISISDSTQSFVTFNNHATTSTNTITLGCAPGESIRDSLASNTLAFAFNSSKGVSFILPNVANAGQNYFNVYDENVIFDGLQIADPNLTSGSTIIQGQTGTTVMLRNCIIDGASQGGGAYMIRADTVQLANCLIVDRQGTTDPYFTILNNQVASYAVNCTFVSINNNTGGGAFITNNAASYARNCIFSGYSNGVGGASNLATADHCIFTASTVGSNGVDGGNNRFNCLAANQFISTTSDFRTKYSSDALDFGTIDTTDLPSSTDIAGTTRPQGQAWDAGAWEFVPLVTGMGVAAIGQSGILTGPNETITKSIVGISGTASVGSISTVENVDASGSITGIVTQGSSGNTTVSPKANVIGVTSYGQSATPFAQVPGSGTIPGQSASGTIGSLSYSETISFTGLTAFADLGSFGVLENKTINGQSATSATGSLSITHTTLLSGVVGSTQISTVKLQQVGGQVSGIAVSGQVGTVTTQTVGIISAIIPGISATGTQGTFSKTLNYTMTGVSATGTRGTVATTSVIAASLSNIHFGLSAWTTNTAYTSGHRISNNGNAYQAVTSGTSATSGTGPTGSGSTISDGSVTWKFLSAIDFTSVQAWANAIPSTLTLPFIGQVWNDGPITTTLGTPFLSLFGHTTTSVNTITLKCAPGESFRDVIANRTTAFAYNVNNGVSFVCPASGAGNVNYFDITDSNVIIDGFQFHDANSASNSTILQTESGSTGAIIQNCIIDGFAQTSGAYMLGLSDQAVMRDCLVVDNQASNGPGIAIRIGSAAGIVLINNTIVAVNNNTNAGVAAAILSNTSGGITVNRNNYYLGYVTPIGGTAGVVPTDHCVFSATSLSYAGSSITDNGNNLLSKSIANQFISTTDFRTKYSSDGLRKASTDTTDLPTAEDISYVSRPSGNWDVGAWQLQPFSATSSAASGQVGTLNTFTASGTAIPGNIVGQARVGNLTFVSSPSFSSLSASGQVTAPTESITTQLLVIGRNATGQTGQFFNLTVKSNLIGQTGSASVGAIVPSESIGVIGNEGDADVGSLSGVGGGGYGLLVSVFATGLLGDAGEALSTAISGIAGNAVQASLAGTDRPTINGRSATGQISSFAIVDNGTVSGRVATAQSGTLTKSITDDLSGISAQGIAGVMPGTAMITGIDSTGQVGMISDKDDKTIGNATASGQFGNFNFSMSPTIVGTVVTGGAGTLRDQILPAALTGVTSQATTGNIVANPQGVILGQSAIASTGIVGKQSSSQGIVTLVGTVANAQLGSIVSVVSPNVLSGTSAVASCGVVSEPITHPMSSIVGTALLGVITPTLLLASLSTVASASAGSVAGVPMPQLAGIIATSGIGTINWNESLTLPGQSASANVGLLIPGDRLQSIVGITASALRGTIVQSILAGLSGQAATSLAGSLSGQSNPRSALVGKAASASVASLSATISRALASLTATGANGTLIASNKPVASGQMATASVGSLADKNINVGITGRSSTGITGTLVQIRNAVITSVQCTTAIAALNRIIIASGITGLVAYMAPNFRRASFATYIDSSGNIQIANPDTMRYTHGVVAPFPLLGVLLESAATNLNPHGDMQGWTPRGTTQTTYGFGGPDGHGTALFVQSGNGNNVYDVSYTFGGTASTQYTHSVYAKAMGYNYLHMQTWDVGTGGTGGIEAWFDIGNGLVTQTNASGTGSNVSATIEIGPDGFYRCSLTGIASTNPTLSLQTVLRLSVNGTDNSINGDGISGILLWGDQVESAAVASSYIPTSGTIQTRAVDIPTGSLNASAITSSMSGVEGGSAVSLIQASPRGMIVGVSGQGLARSPSNLDTTVVNSIVGSGQTGTLSPYEQITGIFGITASSGVSFPVPQPSGILSGRSSVGQTGVFGYSETLTMPSIVGNTNVGNVLGKVTPPSASISAAGFAGTLKLTEQVLPSGVITQGLAGNLVINPGRMIVGVNATGTNGNLRPSDNMSLSGITALGTATSPISEHTAIISGTSVSGMTGTLIPEVKGNLSGNIASGSVGTFAAFESVSPLGVSGHTNTGTFNLTLLATLLGVIGTSQAGLASSRLSATIAPAPAAIGQAGQVSEKPAAVITGQTATGTLGTVAINEAIFPMGIIASAQVSNIVAGPTAILSGTSALAISGVLPRVQSFALPSGIVSAGSAGNLVDKIVYTISGTSGFAASGSVIPRPAGTPNGITAVGQRGIMTITETLPGNLNGVRAIGLASSPIARVFAVFPGLVGTARVGAIVSDIKLDVGLVGISGTGTAGMSRGWLIIVDVATTNRLPTASVLISSTALSDDIPENVDVFSVPQVITLLYPVRGCTVGLYSYPQLVNTVIDEYVEI